MRKSKDKFDIREATSQDTDSIIELLKLCLGEASVKKTEEYWRWKHFDNPFGNSFILLAFDNNILIAVRAFIRWEWLKDGKIFRAVRAVDTVTHPNYRRKGLFRKLTYLLLEKMETDGIEFVYNTPNDNSRPGNLKMGWKEFTKIRLKIHVGVWPLIKNRFKKDSSNFGQIMEEHSLVNLKEDRFSIFVSEYHKRDLDKFKTNISADYIRWRYINVPVCEYGAIFGEADNFLLIFRLKKRGPLKELRIADIVVLKDTKPGNTEIRHCINRLLRLYNADLATITGEAGYIFKTQSKNWGFIDVGRKGLTVTLNALNTSFDEINSEDLWAWSTGDMELF